MASISFNLVLGLSLLGFLHSPVSAAEAVRIGGIFALSGLFASGGQDSKNGAELAAEKINAAGGIKSLDGAKIELVFGDSQSKPASAASETERLITQSKVSVVMGANTSAETIPASVVSERYQIPFLVPMAQSEDITSRGFKWLWSLGLKDSDYGASAIQALQMVQQKDSRLRRVAFVHGDNETGQNAAKSFKELIAKEPGYEFTGDVEYSARAQDFAPIVLKIRDMNAQMVVMAAYLREVIGFARAFEQLDFHPVWIAMSGSTADPKFGAQVGPLANGVINTTVMGLDLPKVKAVDDIFRSKHNASMSSMAVLTYQATNVIAQALEKAASRDPEKIAQALRTIKLPGDELITSNDFIQFDAAGVNKGRRAMLTQWQDGKLVTIAPQNIATGSLMMPKINVLK
ncbi:MAG: ABC transporter substrate-binding protein [Legionella sp.]|nr:ABC transporter substrate-binding protein [Legionella sp.]